MKNTMNTSVKLFLIIVISLLFSCTTGEVGIVDAKSRYLRMISDYTKVLEIRPRDAEVHYNRGNAYQRIGEYDQAISDYNTALKIDPQYVFPYANRGLAYQGKGQYDKAISDFTKVIEIAPKSGNAYYFRGYVYCLQKEYDKAWEDVKKAQALGYNIPPEFLDDLRKASGREN